MRGDRLRQLREQFGYTQTQLAKMVNVSMRSIRNWEANAAPGGESLVELAQVFSVSTDYLLGLVDDPTPNGHNNALSDHESMVLSALRRGDQIGAIKAIVDIEMASQDGVEKVANIS